MGRILIAQVCCGFVLLCVSCIATVYCCDGDVLCVVSSHALSLSVSLSFSLSVSLFRTSVYVCGCRRRAVCV